MHTDPEILALLALGEDAATEVERIHVDECPVCHAELEELAHLAEVGRSTHLPAALVEPRPEVWERVRAELGFITAAPSSNGAHPPITVVPDLSAPDRFQPDRVQPERPVPADLAAPLASPAPTSPSDPVELRPRRRVPRVLALAVAAALALIIGIGIGVLAARPQQPVVVSRAALAALPSWSGASGQAELTRAADGAWVLQAQINTDRPLTGFQRVWLMDSSDPTRMVTVGLLGSDNTGLWTVPPGLDLSQFDLVDVSEEPADDLDPAHSGNSIVRGALER